MFEFLCVFVYAFILYTFLLVVLCIQFFITLSHRCVWRLWIKYYLLTYLVLYYSVLYRSAMSVDFNKKNKDDMMMMMMIGPSNCVTVRLIVRLSDAVCAECGRTHVQFRHHQRTVEWRRYQWRLSTLWTSSRHAHWYATAGPNLGVGTGGPGPRPPTNGGPPTKHRRASRHEYLGKQYPHQSQPRF